MEARLFAKFEDAFKQSVNNPPLSPQALTLALSLITNPSTSDHTLSFLLKTLTPAFSPNPNSLHHHHLLSLLSALARHHALLRHQVSAIIRTFYLLPSTPTSTLVEALSLLFSIDDVTSDVADEALFLSLSFRPCKPSLRQWLLQNALNFSVRPSVLLTVLLGFTKDPYPYTRRVALDVLVMLRNCVVIEDQSLVESCYFLAIELLFDAEDSVRCSAVRTVSEWGSVLVALNPENSKIDCSDALFVQLCSMVRDMSMKVRLEAFEALRGVGMVSDDILLQTLSKKTTAAIKEKNYSGQYTGDTFKVPASAVAFAFVHGLEDEYFEIRKSACRAIRTLAVLSAKFAGEAVNFLMDVLNDDSLVVRLEVLETMHHMAVAGHLKVQEAHLHMFLGTLVDSSTLIRCAARKVLRLTKLQKSTLVRLCIDGLIKNLELYPQEEADIFSVLFNIGENHGKFVINIIHEASEGIEPSVGGKSGFDNAKTAALLVLAISTPVSLEQRICTIPPRIYSYAVTILGRISHGLIDKMGQNTLFSFLSHCSRFTVVPASKFFEGEGQSFSLEECNLQLRDEKEPDEIFEGQLQKILAPMGKVSPPSKDHWKEHDVVRNYVNVILQKVKDVWSLLRVGCIDEVTRNLRTWRKELNVLSCNSSRSLGVLSFTLHYLHVVELLGRLWSYIMCPRKSSSTKGESGFLLRSLEKSLMEMRYLFIGLSKDEELHILELMVVTRTLRMCNVEVCCPNGLINILNTISHMDHMAEEGFYELHNFMIELRGQLHGNGILTDGFFDDPFALQKALKCFSLRRFVLSGELRYKEVAVLVCDNDYLNPLPFIPELPVGIPLEIELYNISNDDRLWLMMSIEDKIIRFIFLDLPEAGDCSEVRKFTFVAPFYTTPRAKYFSLKVCIVMEYSCKDLYLQKDLHGKTFKVAHLCKEKEVYLSMVDRQ